MAEAIEVILDIISTKLSLETSQIWLKDENVLIPQDERLYVVVGILDMNVFASNNNIEFIFDTISLIPVPLGSGTDLTQSIYLDADDSVLKDGSLTTIDLSSNVSNFQSVTNGEVIVTLNDLEFPLTGLDFSTVSNVGDIASIMKSATTEIDISENNSTLVFVNANPGTMLYENRIVRSSESIQIDLISRSDEARKQRYNVLSALTSVYSQQKQSENNVNIFTIPTSFLNLSEVQGGSKINRYTLRIVCHTFNFEQEEISSLPSSGNIYEDFDTRVDDEDSIDQNNGIIEFNIKAE